MLCPLDSPTWLLSCPLSSRVLHGLALEGPEMWNPPLWVCTYTKHSTRMPRSAIFLRLRIHRVPDALLRLTTGLYRKVQSF